MTLTEPTLPNPGLTPDITRFGVERGEHSYPVAMPTFIEAGNPTVPIGCPPEAAQFMDRTDAGLYINANDTSCVIAVSLPEAHRLDLSVENEIGPSTFSAQIDGLVMESNAGGDNLSVTGYLDGEEVDLFPAIDNKVVEASSKILFNAMIEVAIYIQRFSK